MLSELLLKYRIDISGFNEGPRQPERPYKLVPRAHEEDSEADRVELPQGGRLPVDPRCKDSLLQPQPLIRPDNKEEPEVKSYNFQQVRSL